MPTREQIIKQYGGIEHVPDYLRRGFEQQDESKARREQQARDYEAVKERERDRIQGVAEAPRPTFGSTDAVSVGSQRRPLPNSNLPDIGLAKSTKGSGPSTGITCCRTFVHPSYSGPDRLTWKRGITAWPWGRCTEAQSCMPIPVHRQRNKIIQLPGPRALNSLSPRSAPTSDAEPVTEGHGWSIFGKTRTCRISPARNAIRLTGL